MHLILYNYENKIISLNEMANFVGVKSRNTLECIRKNQSYKDYYLSYQNLTDEQKSVLASLLSNQ